MYMWTRASLLLAGFCAVASHAASEPRVTSALIVKANPTCVKAGTTGEEGAVGAALVAIAAPLVKNAVGALGDALVKASGSLDKTYSVVGQGTSYLYRMSSNGARSPNKQMSCIIAFAPRDGMVTSLPSDPKQTDFYAEFRVRYSADHVAFQIEPVYLFYPKRFSTGRDVLELSIGLEFLGADAQAFASAVIPLKRSPSQSEVEAPNLAGLTTGWLPLKAPSEQLENARQLYVQALNAKDQTSQGIRESLLPMLVNHEPVTIKLTLTETKDVSTFLAKVGGFLSEQKEVIANAVTPELLPKSDADRAAASAAKITSASKYALARIDFDEKVAAFNEVNADANATRTAKNEAKSAAVQAKYALQGAAIEAGIVLAATDPALTFSP